jgi:hypothetical protein
MFLLSNFILKQMGSIKSSSAIATYSIAIGLVIYAALYVYVLFYHQEKLAMFNTILIYVVSIDLLLSSALYNKQILDKNENESETESEMQTENENDLNVDTDDELLSEEDELVASDESTEQEEIEIEKEEIETDQDQLIIADLNQESEFIIPTEVGSSINVN